MSQRCCYGLLVFLISGHMGAATFYSIDSHEPPFLHRNNDDKGVIQWDTGDIAREVALSDGVSVNYQGLFCAL